MSRPKGQLRITTTEKKLLFSFCFYVVIGVVALVYFGLATANTEMFIQSSLALFDCEAWGKVDCKEWYKQLRKYSNNWISASTFILLTFAPAVSLLFSISPKKLKEKISVCLHNIRDTGLSTQASFRSLTTRTYQTFH